LVAAIATATLVHHEVAEKSGRIVIDQLFGSPENLRALGLFGIDRLPSDEASLFRLAGIDPKDNESVQLDSFALKRQNDFLNGRIYTVKGWIVAESECALCALTVVS